jgi:hypothetical protein
MLGKTRTRRGREAGVRLWIVRALLILSFPRC